MGCATPLTDDAIACRDTWGSDAKSPALRVFCRLIVPRDLCNDEVFFIGTYGPGCKSKCTKCKNGAECHHVTGDSNCNRTEEEDGAKLSVLQASVAVSPAGKARTARSPARRTRGESAARNGAPACTTAPVAPTTASVAARTAGWAPSATKVRPPRAPEHGIAPSSLDINARVLCFNSLPGRLFRSALHESLSGN